MKLTIGQLITIITIVASLAGTGAVTVYKLNKVELQLDSLQSEVTGLNGTVQLLLGLYIREGRGELPTQEWLMPSHP